MSNAYERGANAGREGREPHVPTYNPVSHFCYGASEELVEKLAGDYRDGYEVGTNQRLADLQDND